MSIDAILTVVCVALLVSAIGTAEAAKKTCLVLADGFQSEYTWGHYQERVWPKEHPGHEFFVRGLLDYRGRFGKWLEGWDVKRIDLEKYVGTLDLRGIDLVILDEVRQDVCDPYETAIIEYVRNGGGLLVYAGRFGLGGSAKTAHSVTEEISSYRLTPLGAILPVDIFDTPSLEAIPADKPESRKPVFYNSAFGDGIDTSNWKIGAVHRCALTGELLAEVNALTLIAKGTYGKGNIVVYTGDDLAWVSLGHWKGEDSSAYINKFSGTLWRRMAALAVGDTAAVPAKLDPQPKWEKGPAYAHPDQPMNFQWGGYAFITMPEIIRAWGADLFSHSVNLYFGVPEEIGKQGVQGWESVQVPLNRPKVRENKDTWMVSADGKPIENSPCYNNPKALELMSAEMKNWATNIKQTKPWVTYGHMGDETTWKNCCCEHCKKAFRDKFGYELPEIRDDFSDEYLTQWMEYHMFKNESLGKMYALAAASAKEGFPGIKMFASLPFTGGMCHGDDLLHTQAGFDILWDHTYPGTWATLVGLHSQILEDTAVLQGRPYVPILNLLQGFDSYDRYPNMPPAEYMREMAWQAVAHGVDSIGWFVYNAYHWILPGTEAWDEAKALADDLLAPLTPTFYEMLNTKQPVGLLFSYSQEATDGLKEQTYHPDDPWKGLIRWWSTHATQEAYEAMKYSQVPFNVVSEHRLLEGAELPWKAIVIPYVEYLHPKSRKALEEYMAKGGKVYVGENSTLRMPGIRKLPVKFDTKFETWWPKHKLHEWSHRRAHNYTNSVSMVKAGVLAKVLEEYTKDAPVKVDDPEVVFSVREAGSAQYIFFINDHQTNPATQELRELRPKYNHFMLMPMEFPPVQTTAQIAGDGYLYELLKDTTPIRVTPDKPVQANLQLRGGDGQIYVLLPEKITAVQFTSRPMRTSDGIEVTAQVRYRSGTVNASLPLQIDISAGDITQTVYATTKEGKLEWTVPFLKPFPKTEIMMTITDLTSGKKTTAKVRQKS